MATDEEDKKRVSPEPRHGEPQQPVSVFLAGSHSDEDRPDTTHDDDDDVHPKIQEVFRWDLGKELRIEGSESAVDDGVKRPSEQLAGVRALIGRIYPNAAEGVS